MMKRITFASCAMGSNTNIQVGRKRSRLVAGAALDESSLSSSWSSSSSSCSSYDSNSDDQPCNTITLIDPTNSCPKVILTTQPSASKRRPPSKRPKLPTPPMTDVLNPVVFLRSMLPPAVLQGPACVSPACQPSVDELKNYDSVAVAAIKDQDVTTLCQLLENGRSFRGCNRNGESLLHLACRLSNVATVTFLVDQAEAPVTVVDTLGRTILHDAIWKSEPDVELLAYLLPRIPIRLLFQKDSRGHTCFDYARRDHWMAWNTFLEANRDQLEGKIAEWKEEAKEVQSLNVIG